jgi:hypothetical protein
MGFERGQSAKISFVLNSQFCTSANQFGMINWAGVRESQMRRRPAGRIIQSISQHNVRFHQLRLMNSTQKSRHSLPNYSLRLAIVVCQKAPQTPPADYFRFYIIKPLKSIQILSKTKLNKHINKMQRQ